VSDRKEIDPERMREIEAWNRELGKFLDVTLNGMTSNCIGRL
jgi:hypothetical protein